MYKLVVFVPESHIESVKAALFAAGAGRIGDYEHCSWQTLGQGQFRPMADANPFIGQLGHLETVSEYRLEMVCDDQYIEKAVTSLYKAHPYEEPAFDLWQLASIDAIKS